MGKTKQPFLIILILAIGVLSLFILIKSTKDPSLSQSPSSQSPSESIAPKPKQENQSTMRSQIPSPVKDPVSLLLIGVDRRRGDVGRADALMVITLNPEQKTANVLNIPRDTKTRLVLGKKTARNDKINHAYSLGNGTSTTVQTVEKYLDIPIHHYIKVDFTGFRSLINLFGGVDVHVKNSFSYQGHHFQKGSQTLNGSQALAYVRDRTGGSDYDRHFRQQQVLNSLLEKGTHWSTLLKLNDLFHVIQKHTETNLSLNQAWKLLRTFREIPTKNRTTLHLTGYDQWQPRYFLIVPESERLRIRRILRKHMELPPY
ncbi:LCP family protein [Melghirimyces algeriensis]|uniref:Transcriptional attenuator, LytR family n=1 Tax=Melghirimyces algeriensis TaxID=910412 RepID=A0A521D3X9_9BACL|nr:LCP family protein [Melghirimyces algeriensis]SMO66406.1 transcriptional attenuator, LytR family [Melghirimyces algeriensis]